MTCARESVNALWIQGADGRDGAFRVSTKSLILSIVAGQRLLPRSVSARLDRSVRSSAWRWATGAGWLTAKIRKLRMIVDALDDKQFQLQSVEGRVE